MHSYAFEIATLPNRTDAAQRMLASCQPFPTLGNARHHLSLMLARMRLCKDVHDLEKVAREAGEVWTDFPEYGITVRLYPLYPRTVTVQCQRVLPSGARCQRPVAVAHGARVAYCWQHSAR